MNRRLIYSGAFLALFTSAFVAFSVYNYRREQLAAREGGQPTASSPLSSPPVFSPPPAPFAALAGRCPTLVPSSPSFLTSNPVLRAIGPLGLPCLPYHSAAAAYAYPLLVQQDYVAQYDPRTRNANWVIELLTPHTQHSPTPASPHATLPPSEQPSTPTPSSPSSPPSTPQPFLSPTPPSPPTPSRTLSTFLPDPSLLSFPTPSLPSHFSSSSYDRGHLIPAADLRHTSQSSLNSSFLMTNIAPQSPALNRRYLAAVEAWLRGLTRTHDWVMVITGPLWLPREEEGEGGRREVVRYEVIPRGKPVVAVPTHFFKLLVAGGGSAGGGRKEEQGGSMRGGGAEDGGEDDVMMALVLPNEEVKGDVELLSFVSSVAAVEEATGWRLFPLKRGPGPGRREGEAEAAIRGRGRPRRVRGEAGVGENVIDVAELALEAQGIRLQPGLGLSEEEKESLARLCRAGGCDLRPFLLEMRRWEGINRSKGKGQSPRGVGGAAWKGEGHITELEVQAVSNVPTSDAPQ